jgi:large subunit ribosomal protein L7/L12
VEDFNIMADLEKLAEELSNLSLLEAAELKEILEERWGVTAAAPMAMAAMPGVAVAAAAEEEEKTEFDVVLTDIGPKKIQVIKAVRSLTTLGLGEAKELVEGAPSTVLEGVNKEEAEGAKAKLEAEGAVVEVR